MSLRRRLLTLLALVCLPAALVAGAAIARPLRVSPGGVAVHTRAHHRPAIHTRIYRLRALRSTAYRVPAHHLRGHHLRGHHPRAHHSRANHHHRRAHVTFGTAAPLRFGVYPWAAPGAVGSVAAQLPDVPDKALAAVHELGGDHPLTVHLYGDYTGTGDAAAQALLSDARWWSDNGLKVEMVLRYRPATSALASGYGDWVGSVAGRLAQLPGLVSLQIGNEANNDSSPAAGDGAYPGAIAAIARAVAVARHALDAAGRRDVGVGINWAAGENPCGGGAFWRALRRAGGPALTGALGWVGIDVYPGTWSGPSPDVTPTSEAISRTVVDSLRCLRDRHMPQAGLAASTSITVSETGYPTDAARSPQLQASVLRETVATVQSVRSRYGVDALNWFSLRDGNTASGQLQNGYGLLRDDYAPKPAFTAYRDIIAAQG